MSFLRETELNESFGPLAVFRERIGFVPNLLRAQTLLPRVIEAQAKLEAAIRLADKALSRVQKERILLIVAAARHDVYCASIHRKVLSSLGLSDTQTDDLLLDYGHAGLPRAEMALLDFCVKLSTNAPAVLPEDIEELHPWGWEDESIHEAVLVTGLASYRHVLSVGLGPDPDFELPKLPSKRAATWRPQATFGGRATHTHQRAGKKGPYVRAPYLSSAGFAPFAILQKSHGFIPNFFRSQTLRPDLLEAQAEAVSEILMPEDILARPQKEYILLAVSAANLNSYCVAVHCNLLRGQGMPPEESDQIAVDHHQSDISKADKALVDFALKVGVRPSEFRREDIDRLRALGFTEEQILECLVVTALNNFANTVQMGLGIVPDFEPPPAFEQKKVHLSSLVTRPSQGSDVVSLPKTEVEDPDAGLVGRAQSGDLEAFEELIRRRSRPVYRALVAVLGDSEEAKDAMQDTLLSAFKHICAFQGRSKFSTWLVSIARNTALERLRGRRKLESLDEKAFEGEEEFRPRQVRAWQDNPEEIHSESERRRLVERAIMELPAKYRIVIMLRDIEQLSTDEVARQLGLAVPALKTRLLRGRLMLREALSPHFSAGAGRAAV